MYKQITNSLFIACLIAVFVFPQTTSANALDNNYRAAVIDAAMAEKDEIVNNLNAATRANDQLVWNEDGTKLMVVTWKATGAYENFIKPYSVTSDKEDYVIWVTLAPQVQKFCSNFAAYRSASKEDLDLRLKQ